MPWIALAYLGVLIAAGYGLTYFSGLPMLSEERLFYGVVIGTMVGALSVLLIALVAGLGIAALGLGAALALAAAALAVYLSRSQTGDDLRDLGHRALRAPWRERPWPLALLLLVTWPYGIRLVGRALFLDHGALATGYQWIIADWSSHLAFAASFAYGDNFPPEIFTDSGHPFAYPYMADFLAGALVPLGATLPQALVLTSGVMLLALPGVMFFAGARLLGDRLAAFLAVLVFALSGGLGFLYLLPEIDRGGLGVLRHLPHEYTFMPGNHIRNVVVSFLLAQRSMLYGIAIPLVAFAVLMSALRTPGWRPFVFAGAVVGLSPLFHVHGFGTALALPAFWALSNRRRHWIGFFLPAVVLAAPALLLELRPGPNQEACARLFGVGPCLDVGWLAAKEGSRNFAWFWFTNTGLLIPLMVAAQLIPGIIQSAFARLSWPIWLWFIVPQIWRFHYEEWDNMKFIIFWLLFGSLLAGGALAWLAKRGRKGVALAAAAGLVLGASGALDLYRALDRSLNQAIFINSAGVKVASWVDLHTDPHAVIAAAPVPTEPVLALSGRRLVIGWDWSVRGIGYADVAGRERDLAEILGGGDQTDNQIRRYHVSYVVVGPEELGLGYPGTAGYWSAHGRLVYDDGGYRIYRVATG